MSQLERVLMRAALAPASGCQQDPGMSEGHKALATLAPESAKVATGRYF